MPLSFFKKSEDQTRNPVIVTMVVFLIIFGVLTAAPAIAYQYAMKDKIFRGVQVDGIMIGGMTKDDAREKINSAITQFEQRGIGVRHEGAITVVKLTNIGLNDPDLAYDVVNYQSEKIIDDAYAIGRTGAWSDKIIDQVSALVNGAEVPANPLINEEKIDDVLLTYFPQIKQDGKDPELSFKGNEITVNSEVEGLRLDVDGIRIQLYEQLSLSKSGIIDLKISRVIPELTKSEVEQHLDEVKALLEKKIITLKFENKAWEISVERFKPYLKFIKKDGKIELTLSREDIDQLLEFIADQVNVPAKDAVMEMSENRVTNFVPSEDGIELKLEPTLENIERDIIKGGLAETQAVVDVAKPKVEVKDINDLGIVELLGTGESDYSGSPYNRRINIAVGAKAVNGIIIPPGKEFSLIETLGDINAANGYLQELVIKGNKTVPEYGGGLCQIGTTTFRGVLQSGLKVTMRRNHSYRVSYYEPAGTDATIYDPWPDFRFMNDTPAHVLIRTINDTKRSKLYFQFWGTRDGRSVEMTKPVVFNIVPPPPPKLIETLDLKPGEKKCTERAHSGADASFKRMITRADGTIEEEKFDSHYRPWQEVCLIGVEKLSSSSTPDETVSDIDVPATDPVNANVNVPANSNQ